MHNLVVTARPSQSCWNVLCLTTRMANNSKRFFSCLSVYKCANIRPGYMCVVLVAPKWFGQQSEFFQCRSDQNRKLLLSFSLVQSNLNLGEQNWTSNNSQSSTQTIHHSLSVFLLLVFIKFHTLLRIYCGLGLLQLYLPHLSKVWWTRTNICQFYIYRRTVHVRE